MSNTDEEILNLEELKKLTDQFSDSDESELFDDEDQYNLTSTSVDQFLKDNGLNLIDEDEVESIESEKKEDILTDEHDIDIVSSQFHPQLSLNSDDPDQPTTVSIDDQNLEEKVHHSYDLNINISPISSSNDTNDAAATTKRDENEENTLLQLIKDVSSSSSEKSHASIAQNSEHRDDELDIGDLESKQNLEVNEVSPMEKSQETKPITPILQEVQNLTEEGNGSYLKPRTLFHNSSNSKRSPASYSPLNQSFNENSQSKKSVEKNGIEIEEKDSKITGWEYLNHMLQENGFSAVKIHKYDVQSLAMTGNEVIIPDNVSLIDSIHDVISQFQRRGQVIQDLVVDSDMKHRLRGKTELSLQSAEKKTRSIEKENQKAQSKIRLLENEIEGLNRKHDKELKSLKISIKALNQKLRQSEHRVNAKETIIDRMKQRLQQQVDKEETIRNRDLQMFQNLNKRTPKKNNRTDSKSLELIHLYETQREDMEQELKQLRQEVQKLNNELRDKENAIGRKNGKNPIMKRNLLFEGSSEESEQSKNQISLEAQEELLQRMEKARRQQEAAAMNLRQREEVILKKVTNIEEELSQSRSRIHELEEENSNLQMEVESRPTIREYRRCQRRLYDIENQLSEQKLALREASDIKELRKYINTKELIYRDKENHKLQLNRLDALPKHTALEIIKEICRELNLMDVSLIGPSLKKMCAVIEAVPRMEQFIRDVCGFVFMHQPSNPIQNLQSESIKQTQQHFKQLKESTKQTLENVLPTLNQWIIELRELYELKQLKSLMISKLLKRSIIEQNGSSHVSREMENSNTSESTLSTKQILFAIDELIETEKSLLHSKGIYKQAHQKLQDRPDIFLHQLIKHFQYLFHVRKLEGMLPKMNELYLFSNEVNTLLNECKSFFQLPQDASPSSCIMSLKQALQTLPQKQENNPSSNTKPHENYVVQRKKSTNEKEEIVGIQKVREMHGILRDLQIELGAQNFQDLVPRTKRLMQLLVQKT